MSSSFSDLSEMVPVVKNCNFLIGSQGSEEIKQRLDSRKSKVLEEVKILSRDHGTVRVVGNNDIWDVNQSEQIEGCRALVSDLRNQNIIDSNNNMNDSIIRLLSGKLISAVSQLSYDKSTVNTVNDILGWMIEKDDVPSVRKIIESVVSSSIKRVQFSQNIIDSICKRTLLSISSNDARQQLWLLNPQRFCRDVYNLHTLFDSEVTAFHYEQQADAIMGYAARLGSDKMRLADANRILQPLSEILKRSPPQELVKELSLYADGGGGSPTFFFALLLPSSSLLMLLLELTESVLGVTELGIRQIPARIRTTSPTALDIDNQRALSKLVVSQAIRMPYIISGIHLNIIHCAIQSDKNIKSIQLKLHHLLSVAYNLGEIFPAAVTTDLVRWFNDREGNIKVVEFLFNKYIQNDVFVNSCWYLILSSLHDASNCLSAITVLVSKLGETTCDVYDVLSLVVTAAGQSARRRRPASREIADLLGSQILCKKRKQTQNFQHLTQFLITSCGDDVPHGLQLQHNEDDDIDDSNQQLKQRRCLED